MATIREDVVSISFDVGKNPLGDINSGIDDMRNSITGGVNDGNSKLKSLAKSAKGTALTLGKGMAKAAVTGLGAATTAVGGLVAASAKAYAEFEQLEGGVKTLFGDEVAAIVQKNANNAFKTAGLSANEYMETVTSFSASLLQSVGGDTKKAASLADMAITDMADNANKMGTDMESLQNAYQGFAKQNYTMLDNLKLGYGGTKEEMARLIKDAAKVDKSIDANSMSYANIVKAINVVQGEMGITGATQAEAATTISGSLAAMKSAWGNTLTAMVTGGAGFDQSVTNLVQSVSTFAKNIIPVVKTALTGVGTLVQELAPVIAKELPALVNTLLPSLVTAGISLLQSLIGAIQSNIGTLSGVAMDVVMSLVQFIVQSLPQLVTTGIQLILSLVNGISNKIPALIPMAIKAIVTLAQGLISMLPQIIQAGVKLIVALVQGLGQAIPQLISYLPEIGSTIIKALKEIDLIAVGKDLIKGFIKGIGSMLGGVKDAAKGIAKGAANAIKGFLGINSPSKLMIEYGAYTGEGLVEGMDKMKGAVKTAGTGLGAYAASGVNTYTPSSSGVSSSTSNSTVNNFNPQFVLNMNGASASESNKRKVKKWVKESIKETFDSMGRISPAISEV